MSAATLTTAQVPARFDYDQKTSMSRISNTTFEVQEHHHGRLQEIDLSAGNVTIRLPGNVASSVINDTVTYPGAFAGFCMEFLVETGHATNDLIIDTDGNTLVSNIDASWGIYRASSTSDVTFPNVQVGTLLKLECRDNGTWELSGTTNSAPVSEVGALFTEGLFGASPAVVSCAASGSTTVTQANDGGVLPLDGSALGAGENYSVIYTSVPSGLEHIIHMQVTMGNGTATLTLTSPTDGTTPMPIQYTILDTATPQVDQGVVTDGSMVITGAFFGSLNVKITNSRMYVYGTMGVAVAVA